MKGSKSVTIGMNTIHIENAHVHIRQHPHISSNDGSITIHCRNLVLVAMIVSFTIATIRPFHRISAQIDWFHRSVSPWNVNGDHRLSIEFNGLNALVGKHIDTDFLQVINHIPKI